MLTRENLQEVDAMFLRFEEFSLKVLASTEDDFKARRIGACMQCARTFRQVLDPCLSKEILQWDGLKELVENYLGRQVAIINPQ